MAKKAEEKDTVVDLKEIKEELTDYVNKEIKRSFSEELERSNKRLIREKNKQLIFRNIVIILLLALVIYAAYLLNSVNFFAKLFGGTTAVSVAPVTNSEVDNTSTKKETFEELKEKYGSLINNYVISENSKYLTDFYNGNLSNELKKYIALNSIDFNTLTVEDDYNVIEGDILNKKYSEIFSDTLEHGTFDYNGERLRYISRIDSYLANSILEKKETNILREITDIKLVDDNVIITTIEGLVIDKKLYNVISKEEIENYKLDSLTNYKDKLNTVVYKFNNSKLVGLSS